MFECIRYWWERFIRRQFDKYYVIGGHCGICGKWVENAIVIRGWEWTLCDRCSKCDFDWMDKK